MPLRAYIARRPTKTDTAVRKRGDVVSVALAEAPTARLDGPEYRHYLVVENWSDAALEAEMRAAGLTTKAYPYASYTERTLPGGRKVYAMAQMSTRFVDFSSLAGADRTRLTTTAVEPARQASTLTAAIKNRTRTAGTVTRDAKEAGERASREAIGGKR